LSTLEKAGFRQSKVGMEEKNSLAIARLEDQLSKQELSSRRKRLQGNRERIAVMPEIMNRATWDMDDAAPIRSANHRGQHYPLASGVVTERSKRTLRGHKMMYCLRYFVPHERPDTVPLNKLWYDMEWSVPQIIQDADMDLKKPLTGYKQPHDPEAWKRNTEAQRLNDARPPKASQSAAASAAEPLASATMKRPAASLDDSVPNIFSAVQPKKRPRRR
jgi:hypothetical protein